jgi:hypothetical protein
LEGSLLSEVPQKVMVKIKNTEGGVFMLSRISFIKIDAIRRREKFTKNKNK